MRSGSYILLIFLTSVLILSLACRKKDKRVEIFELGNAVSFKIEAGLNTFDTHFYEFSPITHVYNQRLEDLGISSTDVVAVEPKFATLRAVFNDEDLDFIEQISIRIFRPEDRSINREIFYLDPVPLKRVTQLNPFPGLSNVKEMIEKGLYGMEIRLNLRFVPQRSIDMRFEYELSVKGNS